MFHRTRTWVFFVLMLAVVCLSMSVVFAQEATPEPVGRRPDAPTYALHGPYWVGVQDKVIDEGSTRPLKVTIWYPALNPKGLPESISYTGEPKLDREALGLPKDWMIDIKGHALLNAAPDKAAKPYPLVIFSHGFGGYRQTNAYLTEHLASYGFVVIAPDHREMWDPAETELWKSTIERPMDIQKTIAYAATLTASDGDMQGLFDAEQIAVVGYSYGGYGALAAGGGLFDADNFKAGCDGLDPNNPNWMTSTCANILSHLKEMAVMAGYNTVPQGPWPSWGDPRVKAIVPLAGSPIILEAGLSKITVPVMAIVGRLELELPDIGEDGIYNNYQYVSSLQKALVTIEGAQHNIFNWSCKDFPGMVDVGFSNFCSEPVWDMERAHDLINHFTTAFLLDVMKDDKEAAKALAPDAVSFPGITYDSQGF
jgi:predicted dienelactone hydrolase